MTIGLVDPIVMRAFAYLEPLPLLPAPLPLLPVPLPEPLLPGPLPPPVAPGEPSLVAPPPAEPDADMAASNSERLKLPFLSLSALDRSRPCTALASLASIWPL